LRAQGLERIPDKGPAVVVAIEDPEASFEFAGLGVATVFYPGFLRAALFAHACIDLAVYHFILGLLRGRFRVRVMPIPAAVESRARWLTWGVVGIGVPFLIYYVLAYVRLARRGYRVSPHKVALYAITGLCSIFTWGFDSFGEAFFIMNLFHAVQYLALVWVTEGRSLAARLGPLGRHRAIAWTLYVLVLLLYGLGAEIVDLRHETLWSITMVVALLHFWYDGFIWSVAKKQI